MACLNTAVSINKDKKIGKVLFIVEGERTEPYILCRIFEKIFDYSYTRISREGKITYDVVSSKRHDLSQVFVVNAEDSNIDRIADGNEYLDNLFRMLINDQGIDFENAAIFYIWDRDRNSNVNTDVIKELLSTLRNPRDSVDYERQGLLLLSYPSIEAYTVSNFISDSFSQKAATGKELKTALNDKKILQQNISENSIQIATEELLKALKSLDIEFKEEMLDDMAEPNLTVFSKEEAIFEQTNTYRLLSMLSIALLNLGLIEVTEQ